MFLKSLRFLEWFKHLLAYCIQNKYAPLHQEMVSKPLCTWECCGSKEKYPPPHPIVSCVWALGSQLVALLEKVREPFGGGVWLTKVHHWRLTLKAFSLVPFHVLSSCFRTVLQCDQWSQNPVTMSPWNDELCTLELSAKTNPSFKLFLVRHFVFDCSKAKGN